MYMYMYFNIIMYVHTNYIADHRSNNTQPHSQCSFEKSCIVKAILKSYTVPVYVLHFDHQLLSVIEWDNSSCSVSLKLRLTYFECKMTKTSNINIYYGSYYNYIHHIREC